MAHVGSAFFTVSDLPPGLSGGPETEPIVVWLRGEHDISTDDALCQALARAIALDSAGLVLDLSGVEFMGASTLGVIVRAREFLRERSASLTVRSPSAFARRVISACGLGDLLGPSHGEPGGVTGKALRSWVAVPATERSDGQLGPSAPAPNRVPAHVGALRAQPVSTRSEHVAALRLTEKTNYQDRTTTEKRRDDL
jgi:anti-anti-sigma factor